MAKKVKGKSPAPYTKYNKAPYSYPDWVTGRPFRPLPSWLKAELQKMKDRYYQPAHD
jgi:hypothetical protein